MFFKINGVSSEKYGIYYKTIEAQMLSELRTASYPVIGVDGEYVSEDALSNKRFNLFCQFVNHDLKYRQYISSEIAAFLYQRGDLSFTNNPGIVYKIVKTTSNISKQILSGLDTFEAIFEVAPHSVQSNRNDNRRWNNTYVPWEMANFTWNAEQQVFNVSGSETIMLNNYGTATAKPLIRINGSGNVTIGNLTISGLNGDLIIDTELLIAHDGQGNNKMSSVTGDIESLRLPVGKTTLNLQGNATIDFDYRNTFR